MNEAEREENRGAYFMDDMDSKKDTDEEPTEDAPLRGHDGAMAVVVSNKENESGAANGTSGKEVRAKGLRAWLAKPRVKWWIAVLVAIILVSIILVTTLLAMEDTPQYYVDTTPRLMKVFPIPKGRNKLIYFRHGSLPHEGKYWPDLTRQLSQLVSGYDPRQLNYKNVTECYGEPPPEGYACIFDIRQISPECIEANEFGYKGGTPCIFLQFPNVSNWEPNTYTTHDLETMKHLPEKLRYDYQPNYAYIGCEGDNIVDKENMGPLLYSPEQGFPMNFFPFTGHPDYMPPIVVLRFQKPKIGVAINVICKLWAKNVNHTENSVPNGTVRFTLLVD
ncbi:sodium/potassium-transporting ATPase subunit beta-2-like [Limulus polyphemus]|uniref:Sodium/potassium-transporting ATPase subunit beta-2-like n=1 Tax=Limulus polyphemus TaxID=6850 RepID=A0ABM1SPQ3_LIMPO|nr:sodium/potassium-transporting ATPase subunit beta-2-like [Limulus polyphemus]XP_022245609.1 sodium/potassium-transporting ATPase subunit beta-2-like [Limulus polyphemus]XP_022245619.1 sodium/potassium-transporting ATPase subunit beta-2-like [Limulus polyphemus]